MPTVPVVNQRQVESRPLSAPRQDPGASSASGVAQIGRNLERVGSVFEDLAQDERDKADRAALMEADTGLDTWEQSNVLDAENGAFTKKGKDAFDLPNQVLPKYDDEVKRIESGLGTERAKLAFRGQAQRRRQQIAASLERHESAERDKFYDDQDTAKIRSSSEMAANYYNDPQRIALELEKQDAAIANIGRRKGWSAEQLADEKRKLHSNIHADVVGRYLARGEFKKGRVYFDEMKDQIEADAATRIEAHFTAERERVKTEVKQSMNDQLRDISAAAALGLPVAIPSEKVLKDIYGEHEGGQRFKIASQAKELSPQVAQMRQMSETQLLAMVADAKPKTQDGASDQAQVANFLEQRAGEILREREKDPAGYMVKNAPATRDAWAAFTQAQNAEERDAAAAKYLKTLRADRERLQITGADVLPDTYADQVVDGLNNPKSAEAMATDIEREATRWGSSWPAVYQQIAPKLSDTAAVVGSGIPRAAAVNLSSVAGLKEAELKGLLPPSVKWKDLEEKVADEFEDFQRSLPSDATRMNNAFRESATRLAAKYVNGGANLGDAVARAKAELVDSQYNLVEFRSTPMRIPLDLDPDIAENGAALALNQYQAAIGDVLSDHAGVSQEEATDAFTNHVRESGYWITNPGGTGLRLYVDGGPVPSIASGTINVTWDKLRALNAAEQARIADRSREESVRRQLAR
jgi:hypothetical protein